MRFHRVFLKEEYPVPVPFWVEATEGPNMCDENVVPAVPAVPAVPRENYFGGTCKEAKEVQL